MRRLVELGLIVTLTALLGYQVLPFLPSNRQPPGEPVSTLGLHPMHSLTGRSLHGDTTEFSLITSNRKWTAVLAFSSHCAWSDSVAEEWSRWLQADTSMRTIAVTMDDHNLAREYIERNDWAVEAISIAGAPVGTPEAQLARITPWVYIFGPDGTLAFDDQGQYLTSLVSLVPIE